MSDFIKGDRVRHKQMGMIGDFVRYGKPTDLNPTWPGRGIQRQVWWRPTHLNGELLPPQKVDYTWEDVMEEDSR